MSRPIAVYLSISDENLEDLKATKPEQYYILEKVNHYMRDAEIKIHVEYFWDVLHFIFTGKDTTEPIENDPLSEAVLGVSSIYKRIKIVAYIEKTRIADIVYALESFDIQKALDKFSMRECNRKKVYPDIWRYEEEVDEIKKEIMKDFQNMKDFYKKILEVNANVLVYFDYHYYW